MSISLKTRKMLWGRAANRCAITHCRKELFMDATETDDESIIGEECHIIAREDDGPRGDALFPVEKRDKYDNLILLCNTHHKLIDDQQNTYTTEKLNEMKKAHIQWIDEALTVDKDKQRDDEIYSTYIDEWENKADLINWKEWSSWVLGSDEPDLSVEQAQQLNKLKIWLLSRIWPKRYPELDSAFDNFRRVLNDFLLVFHYHSTKNGDTYSTEKFYKKVNGWNPEGYGRLLDEYSFHVALVQDLMLELTRSANYICDKVRQFIVPNYRFEEGLLLVESGPFMDFTYRIYRLEYKEMERFSMPYPGLMDFKKIRINRDFCFGAGIDVDDAKSHGID